MFTLSADNTQLHEGRQFTIGDVTYPQNWLTHASAQDLADAGITYTPDPPAPPPPTPPAPTLAQVQAERLALLASECQADIFAGFESSALGAPYTYPAKTTDQANLSASVLSSLLPNLPANWVTPFWCADASGVWAFVPHTAAQIQQVGVDAKNAILAAMQKNATLAAQVTQATTVADVIAIVW